MKQYKVIGTIDLGVIEPDGTKRHIRTVKNTIAVSFASRVATNLVTDQNMIMDVDKFVSNVSPPTDGLNGIAFVDTTEVSPTSSEYSYYSMITTVAHPTANTVVFTGTFTGTDVTISSLTLGKGWINLGNIHMFSNPNGEGGFAIAGSAGTTWVADSFLAAQTITINWTIEVVAY